MGCFATPCTISTGFCSPAGPFVDMGHPLLCGKEFINIDPFAFDDPVSGKHLLYWGSGFAPIKVQELGPDRMSFAPGTSPINLVSPAAGENQFPALVEGAWVVRRRGYYYLFYSGDNCCGPKANYAVMVTERHVYGQEIAITGPSGTRSLRTPMLGLHQAENAATAVATADALRARGVTIPEPAISTGLARARPVCWGPFRAPVRKRPSKNSAISLVSLPLPPA